MRPLAAGHEGRQQGWGLSGRSGQPPPGSTRAPCSLAQPRRPQHTLPPQPGHRVTVNPFPRRMSISRKMRKLEEKSSLAGRREEMVSQTQGSERARAPFPGPLHSHPRSSDSRCQCHQWHTGPSRCRKTGGSGLRGEWAEGGKDRNWLWGITVSPHYDPDGQKPSFIPTRILHHFFPLMS